MGCRRPWRREIVLPSLSYCIKFLFSLIFILPSSTRHRRWLYRILFLFTSFWTSRTNFFTCFGVSWTFLFFPVKIKINIIIYNILSASKQTSVRWNYFLLLSRLNYYDNKSEISFNYTTEMK